MVRAARPGPARAPRPAAPRWTGAPARGCWPRSGASSRWTAAARPIRQLEEMDERYTRASGARDFGSPPEGPYCVLPAAAAATGSARSTRSARSAAHRNRGHARAAVLAALDAAAADGLDPVFLLTDAEDWPQHLYRRLGFDDLDVQWEFLKLPLALDTSIISAMDSTLDDQLAWDKGPLPCVVQDWRTGEVLTRRVHGPRGAAAHARERRDVVLEPLAAGAVAQGRDLGQRAARARAALGLRRRRPAGAGRAGRARPATRASAPASTTATRSPRPARRSGRSSGRRRARRGAGPRTATRPGCWPTPSCAARRCARRPRRSPARPREESDERVAEEAADVLYHLDVLLAARGLSLADAFEVLNDRRR